MGTVERWSEGREQQAGLGRRAVRKLTRRIVNLVYSPGDTPADVSKRAAMFILGWGAFIGLLTWAGYRNGNFHGAGEGILWFCGLFLAAALFAPDYLTPRRPRVPGRRRR